LQIHEPTVFLVRHGKTEFNNGDNSRLKGTEYDLPLTDEGHDEAGRAAEYLSDYPISSIHSSDMRRATETAGHISRSTGVPVSKDSRFDPWDVGYLAGHKRTDAQDRIEYYIKHPDKTVPEGEPYQDWHDRYEGGLLSEMKAAEKEPDKARVVVSHSCNAMAARAIVKGDDPEFYGEHSENPGGVIRIRKTGGQWRMTDVDLPGSGH